MTTPAAIRTGTVTAAIRPKRWPSAAASDRLSEAPASRRNGERMPIQNAAAARCSTSSASSQTGPASGTCPIRVNDHSASTPPAATIHGPIRGARSPARTSSRPEPRSRSRVPGGDCQSRSSISGSVMPEMSPVIAAPRSRKPAPAASSASNVNAPVCQDTGLRIGSVSRRKTRRASTSPTLPRTPRYSRNFRKIEASSRKSGKGHFTRNVKRPRMAWPSMESLRHSIR